MSSTLCVLQNHGLLRIVLVDLAQDQKRKIPDAPTNLWLADKPDARADSIALRGVTMESIFPRVHS